MRIVTAVLIFVGPISCTGRMCTFPDMKIFVSLDDQF